MALFFQIYKMWTDKILKNTVLRTTVYTTEHVVYSYG